MNKSNNILKKLIICLCVLFIFTSLVACSNKKSTVGATKIYSFSGENDKFRLVNGVAVLQDDKQTFYAGNLEIKQGEFLNICYYDMKLCFYDGKNLYIVLNNSVENEAETFKLENQEVGKTSGPILKNNTSVTDLDKTLYFELTVNDDTGQTNKYTLPLTMVEVVAGQ